MRTPDISIGGYKLQIEGVYHIFICFSKRLLSSSFPTYFAIPLVGLWQVSCWDGEVNRLLKNLSDLKASVKMCFMALRHTKNVPTSKYFKPKMSLSLVHSQVCQ